MRLLLSSALLIILTVLLMGQAVSPSAGFGVPLSDLAGQPVPVWKGALFCPTLDRRSGDEEVRVFGSAGDRRVIDLRLPDVARKRLRDSVMGPKGIVAVGEIWRDSGERANGVLFLDHSGRPAVFRRTNPYLPVLITAGPGRKIWTFGQDAPETSGFKDHDTLKCFDEDGNQLFSGVRVSALRLGQLIPFQGGGGVSALLASDNAVGLYLARPRLWIEFNGNGEETGRWVLPLPRENTKGEGARLYIVRARICFDTGSHFIR